jgi:hypothetical protein
MSRVHPLDFPAVQNFILDIQAMQGRAHRLGMVATAHALNKAMNDAGWELAEQVEASNRAPVAVTQDERGT